MKIRRIDHLGIAVQELRGGLAVWRDLLGLDAGAPETVGDQGVRTAFLPLGESAIELLEPTSADTPVGRFLERKGAGVHHVCLVVDDLQGALRELAEKGVRLVDREPRVGAKGDLVAFLHPSSTAGVLVELKQER